MIQERSFKRITKSDLVRLREIAKGDLKSLFTRFPETGRRYHDRLIAIALCQGAALHYLNGKNGVKDFDVWSFFRAHKDKPFPYRRNASADFGISKFGKSPDWDHFVGRRVDLLGRSLPCSDGDIPIDVLRAHLSMGRSASARALAAKAMILIYPDDQLGTVVWPIRTGHA